jgi:NAD(P)-dependent dehydrogenase (short-subunit alcohol dehydrogenase family)
VRGLARSGAQIVLACRDAARAEQAVARLRAELPTARLSVLQVDLASLDSIREAAEVFRDTHDRLDLLCNNAGVMAVPRALTRDGFEMQLGVNHFGHFALTGLLLDRLIISGASRVVTITSMTHHAARLRLNDLDAVRSYNRWEAYAHSKLANLLFAHELQRKLAARGARAISVACHPGYASTNLAFARPNMSGSTFWTAFYRTGNALLAQSAERGAQPTLYAATAPEVQGGDCIGPGGPLQMFGSPRTVTTSKRSHDPDDARALWEISVERTGVTYDALG